MTMRMDATSSTDDSQLITARELAAILQINERTCQRLAARAETGLGNFPRRLKLSAKTIRWRSSDVESYIAGLAGEGRKKPKELT